MIIACGLFAFEADAEPMDLNRFTLTFEDNFTGTSLDTTKWEAATENRQGGNSRWDPVQVSVGNGVLRLGITKVLDPVTGATLRYDCGTVRGRVGYTPNYKFKQKYGYYEARYKLPVRIDKDYWASFWLMAGPVTQTTDTRAGMEIDIMESFTLDRAVHTANFHWGGYVDVENGGTHNKASLNLGAQPQVLDGGYHVYGFYWDKNAYVFYLDGVEIGRTNMVGLGRTDPGLEPSRGTTQAEGYMLLSSEASRWPGDSSQNWDTDAPAQDEFLVDYVRAYDLKPVFSSNPVIGSDATEGTSYQATLAGSATDANDGYLDFTLEGEASWLNVAADGTLSGTPSGGNLGVNSFDVQVSDGISTVQTTLNITVKSKFEAWSSGSTATFTGDANGDGVPDGLAWVLGAPSPGHRVHGHLPIARKSIDGGFSLSFSCLSPANRGAATLSLQFSRDMGVTDPWESHTVPIPSSNGTDPASGVVFEVTPNGNFNQVQATLPATVANGSGRIFCRLRALPAP